MSAFIEEIEYVRGQQPAAVNEKGEPRVAPVASRYNAEEDAVDIGGHNAGRLRGGRRAFAAAGVRDRGAQQGGFLRAGWQGANADFDAG